MAEYTLNEVRHDLRKLAVIAVCFNPTGYRSRYDLYRKFEKHMFDSGVFLFTVECVFESAEVFGLAKQTYEVTQHDNPQHLQLVAPSILWLKENLINIAVQHLPAYIEYVAWIDTDIEFDHLNWPYLVIEELQRYPIVQLFETANFLGPNGKNEVLRRDYSFVYSIKHNKPIDPRQYKEWYPHPGYAWAMRRSTFNNIGGLFECAIVGSGDLHLAFGLLNRIKETFPKNLSEDYQRLAIEWGDRVSEISQGGHNVGYVPINIWHYWHGSKEERGYVERWTILEHHQFSPTKDLGKNNATGVIYLMNRRHIEKLQMSLRMIALERDLVSYFRSRNEDSKSFAVKPSQPIKAPSTVSKLKAKVSGSGGHFKINKSTFPKFPSNYNRPTYVLLPDSGCSHLDDPELCWVDCTCCEHHNHQHNDDCPCHMHYGDEHDCCNETEHQREHDYERPECFDDLEHEEGHHDHDDNEFPGEDDHNIDQYYTPDGNDPNNDDNNGSFY